MKKTMAVLLVGLMVLASTGSATYAAEGRGGFMGFISGFCFGLRAGVDYNDGKEIHWREWVRLVPVVNVVIGVWDGVEVAGGLTRAELANRYGSQYY